MSKELFYFSLQIVGTTLSISVKTYLYGTSFKRYHSTGWKHWEFRFLCFRGTLKHQLTLTPATKDK